MLAYDISIDDGICIDCNLLSWQKQKQFDNEGGGGGALTIQAPKTKSDDADDR